MTQLAAAHKSRVLAFLCYLFPTAIEQIIETEMSPENDSDIVDSDVSGVKWASQLGEAAATWRNPGTFES